MFTCTNIHNRIITVQLCDAHEFEWRDHDPANNVTVYQYPGMGTICVNGFIEGDNLSTSTKPSELDVGRQWYIVQSEWEGGNFKGLMPGDIVTISSTIWDSTKPGSYTAWVLYDDRIWPPGDLYTPTSIPLFTQADVDADRIRFYK